MTADARTRLAMEAFLDAFEKGDIERIAGLIATDNFSYEGPIDRFDRAVDFLDDLEKYALILKHIERRRLFVDGLEGCAVITFVTSVEDIQHTRAVVWVRTDAEGLIVRIENFLDARAFSRMFEVVSSATDNG